MHKHGERAEQLEKEKTQRTCEELAERPSGGDPSDEPEQGTPPIVIRREGDDRVLGPKNEADAIVDEASEESFPASDPPSWPASRRDSDK